MSILLSDSYKVINWDLNSKMLDTVYWGKTTDSGRGVKVAINQNGVLKTPTTETMRINFKKPSGLQIFIDGVISGNYFVFDFSEQVYAEQGNVSAELMLNVSSEFVMSSTFIIEVNQSFTSAIESSSELTALQTALADVDEVKNDIIALENPTFTEAVTLANVVSGESQATLWGKVKKMFSFIGTTTLTTTAQTITTAINELVTKTAKTDFTSNITLNANFTLLAKKAVIKNNRAVVQFIAYAPNVTPANTSHNFATIGGGYKPVGTNVETTGCIQDGNGLYNGGLLVTARADTGAINISSDVALTTKYVQFTLVYDID